MSNVIPLQRQPLSTPDVVVVRFHHPGIHDLSVTVEDYRDRETLFSGSPRRVATWLEHNGFRYATGSAAVWVKDYRGRRGK